MQPKCHSGWARDIASRFPLTPVGVALLLGAGGLLWWTHHIGHDHTIRVAAWACIALILIAAMLTWLTGNRQRKRIAEVLSDAQLDCGEALPTAGRLLRVRYIQPPADESGRLFRRGHLHDLRFRLHDPLELVSMECVARGVDLLVLPRPARPAVGLRLPSEVAAGEEWSARGKPAGDMHEIGEYRRGDPLRFVLWKVSARRGSKHLYVRRPETVGDSKLAFYFMAGPGDDPSAALLHFMIREQHLNAADLLLFNTDHPDASLDTGGDALRRLAASGNTEPSAALSNLDRFLEESLRRRVSACFIFLPAPQAEQVAAGFPETGLPTYFVAGIDAGLTPPESREGGCDIQFIPMEPISST
ncbi:MAG TPA: DUF58 domain-containing protein [Kiritimatiellia bacterium]|nr:DUF58 domain-containing protein [Kiritimatiellia bacterium]